ncbi:MAG: methyltransferase domain-containing protein [Actinomycetota bacterium]
MGWTKENVRHAFAFLRQGTNPAAAVYESIGEDFPLALAPGWLNLGLWEGDGTDPEEAPAAVRRLAVRLAEDLPKGGVTLDVGNGLGAQDPVIAGVVKPRHLIALNITEAQLRAGKQRLAEARALGVAGDAVRLPVGDGTVDGVISIEAAFHFPSRASFFREAARVLRPGGVLTMSDVPTERMPRGPVEALAGLAQLRFWGLTARAAQSTRTIVQLARAAGFEDIETTLCGDRVIDPALRFVRRRLPAATGLTSLQRLGVRVALAQVELLRRRGSIDYLLLSAKKR